MLQHMVERKSAVKTITFDQGSEFARYKTIEKSNEVSGVFL